MSLFFNVNSLMENLAICMKNKYKFRNLFLGAIRGEQKDQSEKLETTVTAM